MATQPGSGAHPKKVRERQRRKAKYPDPLAYTPDSFWTEFAEEVRCCRIASIDVAPVGDKIMMSVGIQSPELFRWYTALTSDLGYWWDIKRIHRHHNHSIGATT